MESHLYLPFQPSFELGSHYKNLSVSHTHPLYGLVTDFYQISFPDSDAPILLEVLPDACPDLIFQITEKSGTFSVSANIIGSSTYLSNAKMSNAKMTGTNSFFGIRFYPGAIRRLFDLPAAEFTDHKIPLSDILSEKQLGGFLSIIEKDSGFNARVNGIEAFILNALSHSSLPPPVIPFAIYHIIGSNGNVRIDDLAEKTGYTNRYLRQLFSSFVGLSPKEFCEIIRFQKSFNEYHIGRKAGSLSELAAKYGYSDHAQMNKAYVKLSCYSPSKLSRHFAL